MAKTPHLRIGTRASALARWQAEWVAARLTELGASVELAPLSTHGDREQEGPIAAIGSEGIFTKEIQRALLSEEVDLAVHSLKDLPTEPVDGLVLAAVPPRESATDVLISNVAGNFDQLVQGAVIGTGSLRRQAQLLHIRPDFHMKGIRGNVDSRIRKLDEGDYDAIVLAEAGLKRLGIAARITERLDPSVMLPAVGQGALGIETRSTGDAVLHFVSQLDDLASRQAVTAERALLAALRGGCAAPVGAWGRVEKQTLLLTAAVLSFDGKTKLQAHRFASPSEAIGLGRRVADELFAQGAAALIDEARRRTNP